MDETMNVAQPTSQESYSAPASEAPQQSYEQVDTSYSQQENSASQSQPEPSGEKIISSTDSYDLVQNEFGKREVRLKQPVASAGDSDNGQNIERSNTPPSYEAQQQGSANTLSDSFGQAYQDVNAEPQTYTIEEFSRALANNQVDERRVPEALREKYTDYKINQAINEFNQQKEYIAQQRAAQQAELEKQMAPEERSKNMREFYTALEEEASERAMADAGFTEEDKENLEWMDDNDEKKQLYLKAKEWHSNEIMRNLQERANRENYQRQAQQQVYDSINNFVAEAQKVEPNFHAIDVIMETRYQTLPLNQGRIVESAITSLKNGTVTAQQAEVLRKYYNDCRMEYYGKQNGVSRAPQQRANVSRPPVVERAGDGREIDTSYTPDYGKLRNADVRAKRAWVAEFLRNRNR